MEENTLLMRVNGPIVELYCPKEEKVVMTIACSKSDPFQMAPLVIRFILATRPGQVVHLWPDPKEVSSVILANCMKDKNDSIQVCFLTL
jgi:hypothetical protein